MCEDNLIQLFYDTAIQVRRSFINVNKYHVMQYRTPFRYCLTLAINGTVCNSNGIFPYHVSSYYSLNALPSAVAGEDTKGCNRDYLQCP